MGANGGGKSTGLMPQWWGNGHNPPSPHVPPPRPRWEGIMDRCINSTNSCSDGNASVQKHACTAWEVEAGSC